MNDALLGWVAEGSAYPVRVLDETGAVLQEMVVARGTDPSPLRDGVALRADPNPMLLGPEWEETRLCWTTVDAALPVLEVAEYQVSPWMPSSAAAMASALDSLSDLGVTVLVLPSSANEWSIHHPEAFEVLSGRATLLHADHTCRIFELQAEGRGENP